MHEECTVISKDKFVFVTIETFKVYRLWVHISAYIHDNSHCFE